MKESPVTYEIRIEGLIDGLWAKWFDGMKIIHANETETILLGELQDQSALYGVIERIRNLGLDLISINRINGK